jgi:hypothetical protein
MVKHLNVRRGGLTNLDEGVGLFHETFGWCE